MMLNIASIFKIRQADENFVKLQDEVQGFLCYQMTETQIIPTLIIMHNFLAEQLHVFNVTIPSEDQLRKQGGEKAEITLELTYDTNRTLSKDINLLRKPSPIVFIETDKPFYNPGDLVQFRILHLDQNLKPVSDPVITFTYNQSLFNSILL
jgi:hypothetical protein